MDTVSPAPRTRSIVAAVTAGAVLVAVVGASIGGAGERPAGAAASSSTLPETSEPAGFADGAAAGTAAEGLLGAYIESEYGVPVTDVACSSPPAGAEGEQFVCYGLKPDSLVIALRATIGPDRLITLELVTDQQPPPPPPTTSSTTTSVAAPATTTTTSPAPA